MIDRREFGLGLGAAGMGLMLPGMAHAQSRTRRFRIYRGDSDIGEQTITVTREGGSIEVAVDVDIAVRILGIAAYRYTLQSRETWEGGQLLRLDAECNDDGTAEFARARREGDTLDIEGSQFSGTVRGTLATTTYWTPDFLQRSLWVSTQDGTPFEVGARDNGMVDYPTETGSVRARHWSVTGDLAGLELFYDEAGEWIGNRFDAEGETAEYRVAEMGGALAELWS